MTVHAERFVGMNQNGDVGMSVDLTAGLRVLGGTQPKCAACASITLSCKQESLDCHKQGRRVFSAY